MKRRFQHSLAILLAAILLVPGIAAAAPVSNEDLSTLKRTSEWYDASAVEALPCGVGAGDVAIVGSNDAEKVWNFFVAKGYKPFQVAGMMGNMQHESGIQPQRLQGTASGVITLAESVGSRNIGWGLVQWTPASKFIDTQNPIGVANLIGTQVNFLWQQLEGQTDIPEKFAGDELKGTTSIEQATLAFQGGPQQLVGGQLVGPYVGYERPANRTASVPSRYAAAKGFLALYGSNAPSNDNTVDPNAPISGCGGVGAPVEGFVFPLITTQSRVKGNKPYPWCFSNLTTNCHHHYNAADIMISEGTAVVAAYPGVVKHTTDNPGRNAAVGILGDDKNFYFYQHLAPGSLKVSKDNRVVAGTPLGTVGNWAAAFDTPPHLHFDMLPPPYEARVSCAGGSCMSYPFINVQPTLVKAFEGIQP